MNNPLSDSSWLILGLIIIFFIATNLGLWAAWKRKSQKNQYHWLQKFGDTIRNPWQKEKARLDQLSKLVEDLRDQKITNNHQSETKNKQPFNNDNL